MKLNIIVIKTHNYYCYKTVWYICIKGCENSSVAYVSFLYFFIKEEKKNCGRAWSCAVWQKVPFSFFFFQGEQKNVTSLHSYI